MTLDQLRKEYKKYRSEYETLQGEVKNFVEDVIKEKKSDIDICESARCREGGIKKLEKIEENLSNGKYKKDAELVDLKDIAGVRVVVYCKDDAYRLANILTQQGKEQYGEVKFEEKKESYRALHLDLPKTVQINEKEKDIYCEVQIRTVTEDAWAKLDQQYRYNSESKVGEVQDLTNAISAVMDGCEKLWTLVKSKNQTSSIGEEASKIQKSVTSEVDEIKEIGPQLDDPIWFQDQKQKAYDGFRKN